ncbi:MAG: hypothetical protein KDB45_05805 [Mycobacterium sp.]|nr:hypothetical protein [Mycobacterium sp.]
MSMALKISGRRLIYVAVGAAIALAPAIAVTVSSPAPAPRLVAECNDLVDTTDSFSMDCVPTVMPDVSDQLTEAEVAEPGWNAHPGGGVPGGGAGGGGHR